MPTFNGVSHISFSVRDCEKTATWWKEVFGLPQLTTLEHDTWRAVLLELPDGNAIEFQQHDTNAGETFDPVRTWVLKSTAVISSSSGRITSSSSASPTRRSPTASTARC